MPVFCLKCPICARKYERVSTWDDITDQLSNETLLCDHDGTPLMRDWQAEKVSNNFHPTRDLYLEKHKKNPRPNPFM